MNECFHKYLRRSILCILSRTKKVVTKSENLLLKGFNNAGKRLFFSFLAFPDDGGKLWLSGEDVLYDLGRNLTGYNPDFNSTRYDGFFEEGSFAREYLHIYSYVDYGYFYENVTLWSTGRLFTQYKNMLDMELYGKEEFGVFIGENGYGKGQFKLPLGIDCRDDVLYVADQLNGRIQVLEYLSTEGKEG